MVPGTHNANHNKMAMMTSMDAPLWMATATGGNKNDYENMINKLNEI